MELGIFAEVRFSGEVTPREVVRSRSKVEVSKLKKVFTKITRFMVMFSFSVLMNWRKGLLLGFVCLKPSPLGRHPKWWMKAAWAETVSYTHLTLPTNREV